MHGRSVVACAFTALLAGCAAREARETPLSVAYDHMFGRGTTTVAGAVCFTISGALAQGTNVTLLVVPLDSGTPARAIARTIVPDTARACNDSLAKLLPETGDSVYYAGQVPGPDRVVIYLVLATDRSTVSIRNDSVFATLGGAEMSFRTCTSSEGVHLTAWIGAPLTGRRVWRRYHYVGYDMEPSCVEADWKDN